MKKNALSLNELEEIVGSKERVLFFLTWLKHDRNATQAYMELHPNCSEHTARVGGSRVLAKIDTKTIMGAYGLGQEKYFDVLRNAMDADKWNDFTGEREKDYKTIKPYHDKLGKLLGIETNEGSNVQVNIANIIQKQKENYGI